MPRSPTWRQLELALIEVIRRSGVELTADKGDTYVEVDGIEVCVGDFARELEKELEA